LKKGWQWRRSVGDRSVLSEGLRELGELYAMEGNLTAAARVGEEALASIEEAQRLLQDIYTAPTIS
jgi:hypothetical protein